MEVVDRLVRLSMEPLGEPRAPSEDTTDVAAAWAPSSCRCFCAGTTEKRHALPFFMFFSLLFQNHHCSGPALRDQNEI